MFHRPTNLAGKALVLIRVVSPQRVGAIQLNGSPLADGDDAAGLLADSNRLTIELERVADDAGVLDAHLEIFEEGAV